MRLKGKKEIRLRTVKLGKLLKCLIVGLVFSHLGFWSGDLFLIAPFPDLCLLVPFYYMMYEDKNVALSQAIQVVRI